MKEIARRFGISLDNDQFEETKELLSRDCKYIIGSEVLIGPEKICQSYEQNMIEGRKKLDKLEWGQSRIEPLSDSEFFVHFTDYLSHKGLNHTHRCKQKLSIDDNLKIYKIEHIDDVDEQAKLKEFYKKVRL